MDLAALAVDDGLRSPKTGAVGDDWLLASRSRIAHELVVRLLSWRRLGGGVGRRMRTGSIVRARRSGGGSSVRQSLFDSVHDWVVVFMAGFVAMCAMCAEDCELMEGRQDGRR